MHKIQKFFFQKSKKEDDDEDPEDRNWQPRYGFEDTDNEDDDFTLKHHSIPR